MDPSILRDYYVIPLVKDLPICTPDGFFAKLQSNASSSTYYCSDREGNAIESFHGIAQDSTEGMESVIYSFTRQSGCIFQKLHFFFKFFKHSDFSLLLQTIESIICCNDELSSTSS